MLLLFLYVSSITPCFGHDVTLTEYTIDTCIYVNRCNSKNFLYHIWKESILINFHLFTQNLTFCNLASHPTWKRQRQKRILKLRKGTFYWGEKKKKNIKSIKHTFCNIYKYYFLQSNENCSSNYNNEWNRQWSRRIARVYAKDRR